jgi:hypothetical protein
MVRTGTGNVNNSPRRVGAEVVRVEVAVFLAEPEEYGSVGTHGHQHILDSRVEQL